MCQMHLRDSSPPFPRAARRRLPSRGYVGFSWCQPKWPSSHSHFTDSFRRARTPRLCSLPCRRSRYCRPFDPRSSFDPRSFPPSSNLVYPGEEANLRFLHVFIPDTGISRTQTQTACYPRVWGLADGLLISDPSSVKAPSRNTASYRRPQINRVINASCHQCWSQGPHFTSRSYYGPM